MTLRTMARRRREQFGPWRETGRDIAAASPVYNVITIKISPEPAPYRGYLDEFTEGMTAADFLLPDTDDHNEEQEEVEDRSVQHLRERDAAQDEPDDEVSPGALSALEAALGAPGASPPRPARTAP